MQPIDISEKLPEELNDLIGAVECMSEYLDDHKPKGKAFEVLKALTSLTMERLRHGKDIKVTAFNIRLQVEGMDADERTAAQWLSSSWKSLEEKMSERENGLQQYAVAKGLTHYPWIEKDKSLGGKGNTSYFYLTAKQINHDVIDESQSIPLEPNQLRYIRELTPKPAWWANKLLSGGYTLEGWRRWLIITYAGFVALAVGLFVILAWFSIRYSPNLTTSNLFQLVLSVALIGWAGWFALGPYIRVFDWRITMAPDILISLKETNVQLELFRDQKGPPGVIRLVRYAGTCPICNGRVLLSDGKKEFPNRLVGRCEESPAEHVYSFDRKTLLGKPLR